MRGRRLGGLSAAVAMVTLGASVATGSVRSRPAARTVWDSVYSANQAARGETAYAKGCARCHGAALTGGDQATPLTGPAFLGNWNGQSLIDLQQRIKTTMPSDSIGIYDQKFITDVVAFMLKANGFPAGQAELSTENDSLKTIVIRASRPVPPN